MSLGLEESYWARGQASINRAKSGEEGAGIILRRKILGMNAKKKKTGRYVLEELFESRADWILADMYMAGV